MPKTQPAKRTRKTKATWRPSIGDAVLIRTVTNYYTGRIENIDAEWIVLGEAAWIADTGRFHTALASGSLSDVEPYLGACAVARGAIVDVCIWGHSLPRVQK